MQIKEIIRQGIEVPEGQNDLRRQQLRELALLNGTLRENDGLAWVFAFLFMFITKSYICFHVFIWVQIVICIL